MCNSRRLLIVLAVSAATTLSTVATARAGEEAAVSWGLVATELSTAGVFALNFGVKGWPNQGPALALNMSPIVIGLGAGWAAHKADATQEPALAIHGASLLGFDLMLVGMLIDGRNERDGLRLGTTAWVLGGVGAAAGGYLGATRFEGEPGIAFIVAPMGGFVAGGILGTVGTALATHDGTKAFKGAVIGAAAGSLLGFLGAVIYNETRDDENGQMAATRRTTASRSTKPVMFSFGGQF